MATGAMSGERNGGTGRPYGGLSPDVRRAERRRRILDAALERFADQGFAATTLASLCRTAGVAFVKFYEEFSGKEDVLRALASEVMTEAVTGMLDAVAHARPALEARTRAGMQAFAHSMLDDPRRTRVVLVESVGVSHELEQDRRSFLREFAELLIALQDELPGRRPAGERTVSDRMIAMAMIGGIQEAMIDWLHTENRPDVDELAAAMADMLVAVGTLTQA